MSKDLEATSHNPASEGKGETSPPRRASISATEKSKWERLWPVIACGAGLFSDGYLNNVSYLQCDYAPPTRGRTDIGHR